MTKTLTHTAIALAAIAALIALAWFTNDSVFERIDSCAELRKHIVTVCK